MSNEYPPPPPPSGDDQSGGQGGGWGTPPPPPPPPNYAYPPGYAQPQPPKNSGMAITSLVLGILGILCCGCGVFSIAALVLGILAKKEIAESNGTKTGAGLAQAGFILGIVGLVLGVIQWLMFGLADMNMYSDYS